MRNLHFVIILLALASCKRTEEIHQEYLYGKWDIIRAERNGLETSYLNGGYFVIEDEGMMTVNITGEEERGSFTLDKDRLQLNDKEFDIQSLKADSLVIRYTPASHGKFVFYMVRHTDEDQ